MKSATAGQIIAVHRRLTAAVIVGILGAIAMISTHHGALAPLVAWDAAGVVFLVWMWTDLWAMSAGETAKLAVREDPGVAATDILLIVASIVSLAAVGVVLVEASDASGTAKSLEIAFGVASVVVSWAMVHTIFALRYARLYYGQIEGGVDFNSADRPRYSDFAYLAFTIGMTFQVSDTAFQTKAFRAVALRHALLSYLFGTVIVATTINLVAGLVK